MQLSGPTCAVPLRVRRRRNHAGNNLASVGDGKVERAALPSAVVRYWARVSCDQLQRTDEVNRSANRAKSLPASSLDNQNLRKSMSYSVWVELRCEVPWTAKPIMREMTRVASHRYKSRPA